MPLPGSDLPLRRASRREVALGDWRRNRARSALVTEETVTPPSTDGATAGNPLPARVCVSCGHHRSHTPLYCGATPIGPRGRACDTVLVSDPTAIARGEATAQSQMASSPGSFSDEFDKVAQVPGVGDLVLSTEGSWMVRPPELCANRHRLGGNCLVSATPCQCQSRHMSWSCNSCGHVTYGPALGPQCNLMNGPAWVR